MRVLLDECVPRRLQSELDGIDVNTVAEVGWSGKTNGELIQLMRSAGFEVLVTVDQGLPHQQNIAASSIALIVLHGASNKFEDLRATGPVLAPSTLVGPFRRRATNLLLSNATRL